MEKIFQFKETILPLTFPTVKTDTSLFYTKSLSCMFLEAQLLYNKIDVILTQNITFCFIDYISVVCGSIWTFFTNFHLEFDKEAISDS